MTRLLLIVRESSALRYRDLQWVHLNTFVHFQLNHMFDVLFFKKTPLSFNFTHR